MKGLTALAIAYVFSQFYRSFLPVLTPQLTAELGASKADLSLASGLWFLSFGVMQFAVGVGLDRYGPRMTSAILFGVAGTGGALVFATAESVPALLLAMILFGIGSAPVLMAAFYLFARKFDAGRFALLSSWLVAFGSLGNLLGAAPLAAAMDSLGWRSVMLILAGGNLLVAFAIMLFVDSSDPRNQQSGNLLSGYMTLLKTPALWAIFPLLLLCYAPVAGIRGLWAGPYLIELHAADSVLIGEVMLWMAVAMVAGSFIYGPLDRLLNTTHKWIAFWGNALVLIAIIGLAVYPNPGLMVSSTLFVVIGLFGTSYGVLMAHGKAFLPPELLGRGVTLMNFFTIFGVGLMQLLTGAVMDASEATMVPALQYRGLFLTYAVCLLIALLLYLRSADGRQE
jgi:sugar phosphate permease